MNESISNELKSTIKTIIVDCLKSYLENGLNLQFGYLSEIDSYSKENVDDVVEDMIENGEKISKDVMKFLDNEKINLDLYENNSFRRNRGLCVHIICRSNEETNRQDLTEYCRNIFNLSMYKIPVTNSVAGLFAGIFDKETFFSLVSTWKSWIPILKRIVDLYNAGHIKDKRLVSAQDMFVKDYISFIEENMGKHFFTDTPVESIRNVSQEYKNGKMELRNIYGLWFNNPIKDNRRVKENLCRYTIEFFKNRHIEFKETPVSKFGNIKSDLSKNIYTLPKSEFISASLDASSISGYWRFIILSMNPYSWESIGVDEACSVLPSI